MKKRLLPLINLSKMRKKKDFVQNVLEFNQNSQLQIEEYKKTLKAEREKQTFQRISNLNNIIDQLGQEKNKYLQSIEMIIFNIKKQIEQLQNEEKIFILGIESIKSFDFREFSEQEQQINKSFCFETFKNNLQSKLMSFTNQECFQRCIDILENFDTSKTTIFEDEYRNQNQVLNGINLLCDEHQENIIFVDQNQNRENQNRFACVLCVDKYPSKYKSIKTIFEEWKQIQEIKKEKMNKSSLLLKKKVKYIQDYFHDLGKKLENMIKDLNNGFDINVVDFINKLQDQQKIISISLSWQKQTKEQLLTIINQIIQQKDQQIFQDPLQNDFILIDRQINQIVKDTVLQIRQTQFDSFNKIMIFNQNLKAEYQNIQSPQEELQIISQSETSFNMASLEVETRKKQNQQQENQQKMKQFTLNSKIITHYELINQSQFLKMKQLANYRFIQQCSITQQDYCYAIAINQDQSIVIAGCLSKIQIYQFQNTQLSITQVITQHTDDVNCLIFMKQTNLFLSGSDDKSIRIWEMKQNNQWSCQQKLDGHLGSIFCLIYNKTEDLIISGSLDKTIKFWGKIKNQNNRSFQFWGKQKEWLCTQTITTHRSYVFSLCLNESSTKLISCGRDHLILVIQKENENWVVHQTITVEQYGLRVCFINDHTFTFQPRNHNKVHIYQMQDMNYIKTKEIFINNGNNCDCLFPQQFIKQKSILVIKNGSNLNFIKVNPNSEFILEHSIEFNTHFTYGTLSDDGKYLLSWDSYTQELKIRRKE
ncbi:unnamed protein product [Paramecium sonneborni]|uniref:WD40-repeat-containing domain n=1 Tax=Paramecium sonneborni TaxID=65129 RepID=A0A8S1RI99_9CILI|nr:unnamed protein product [Paramecium sonneborni]